MPPENAQKLLHRTLLGEAMECAGAAVFVWNEDRHYVAVNDAACELVGLTRAELVGMPVGGLTIDYEPRAAARRNADPPARGQSSFTRRDGDVVDLEWVTVPTYVAGLPSMVSVCWRAR